MRNPFMSAWLSAANKTAGAARGQMMAEAQRQQQAFARGVLKAWGLAPPPPAKKPAAKRRRK